MQGLALLTVDAPKEMLMATSSHGLHQGGICSSELSCSTAGGPCQCEPGLPDADMHAWTASLQQQARQQQAIQPHLRQGVKGVEHLDGHQDRQGERGGLGFALMEVAAGVIKGESLAARGVWSDLRDHLCKSAILGRARVRHWRPQLQVSFQRLRAATEDMSSAAVHTCHATRLPCLLILIARDHRGGHLHPP